MVVTFYQQNIVWGDAEANRRNVEMVLATAPRSDIFVVPETFTTGFGDHMAALAEMPEGPTLRWAQEMASKHDLLFVGTWIVKEEGKCYNRLHWIYPDGTYDISCRGTQRKVFEYKGWKIKPAVCYDLRFPKWLRNDHLDYDLLLVCANWPGSRHQAWTTLIKARAIENLSYVLGCNRCGVDGVGGNYTGNSALIDFKGFPLAEAEAGVDQLVTVTLDKEKLDTFRQHWPLYLDFD